MPFQRRPLSTPLLQSVFVDWFGLIRLARWTKFYYHLTFRERRDNVYISNLQGGIKEVFDGLCVTIHTSSPLKLSSHLSTLRIICDVEEGGATFHIQEHDRFLQPLRCDRFQRLLAFDRYKSDESNTTKNLKFFHLKLFSNLWPPNATCGRCLMRANSKQDKCDLITPRCLSYDQAFQLAKVHGHIGTVLGSSISMAPFL
jgi:hypothetical protein